MHEAHYKEHYPEAVWGPDAPPPVGTRVVMRGGRTGTVLGPHVPQRHHLVQHPDCPGCTCPRDPPFKGWWVVRWDDVTEGPGSAPLETVEYPPSLGRV